MLPKSVRSRSSRMKSIHMSQIFRLFPLFLVFISLSGCGGGGSNQPAATPLSISASGIEGGVVLRRASTGEEWTITENGTVSIADFVLDGDIEISVKPTSALQVCRINGQSDSVTIRATDSIDIECDNKILFVSLAGFKLEVADSKLWLVGGNGETQALAEGRIISLFSKIGLYHYFDLDNELWRTDGTMEGTVPVELDGKAFSSSVLDFIRDDNSFFFIAKDPDEKAFLYEVDSGGVINPILVPERIDISELSIAKVENNYVFYNRNEKRFFTIDTNGLISSMLVLEETETPISTLVYDNELLILTMFEDGVRKLRSLSGADSQFKIIPLPTSTETPITADIYGDNTLLFNATQEEGEDKACKIIYRYKEAVFEVLVDYCNQRTNFTHYATTYHDDRLLILERANSNSELYDLLELDLSSLTQQTLASAFDIKGGVSEMTPTNNFLFMKSRTSIEQDCSNFILCNYLLRYYALSYQTGEIVELVDSNIESGRHWFISVIHGLNAFKKATIFDRVFFQYTHVEFGLEPWVTDGTVAGTKIVKDIKPGAEYGLFPDVEGELQN